MIEEVIFSDKETTITNTLAKIRGVSYPINGIGSVRIVPPDRSKAILWGVVFLVLGFVTPLFFVGAALAVLVAISKTYALIIRTASGDSTALVAKNREDLSPCKQL